MNTHANKNRKINRLASLAGAIALTTLAAPAVFATPIVFDVESGSLPAASASNVTVTSNQALGNSNFSTPLNVQYRPVGQASQLFGGGTSILDGRGGGSTVGPVPVPEPATVLLIGLGLVGFAAARRKKI